MLSAIILLCIGAVYTQHVQQCQKLCTAQYSPVCGSDHHTYSSMCRFEIAQCEAKFHHRLLFLASHGACHGSGGHTTYFDCGNQDICNDEEFNPVCGNNGVTYRNPCLLHEDACAKSQQGVKIMQAHTGECSQGETGLDCSQSCGNDLDPVCSAGNRTFRNACQLKSYYCRYASHGDSSYYAALAAKYTIAHQGTCDGTDPTKLMKMDCSQFRPHSTGVAVEGGNFINCPYTHSYNSSAYVCGSDGHSYHSLCYYCQTMDKKHMLGTDSMVSIYTYGRCPSYLVSSPLVVG